jgi:radical SAM-linked protein
METLKVLQRACVRAGLHIEFTRGFNPHPKLSLPLPRPVGLESEDELLCFRMVWDPNGSSQGDLQSQIKNKLQEQLPAGLDLVSVRFAEANRSIQPRSAAYVFPATLGTIDEELREAVKHVLESESLVVERTAGPKSSTRKVDVRRFLKSIELQNNQIVVKCEITPSGTIRVEEILELLGLEASMLTAPVRRVSVQWQETW